MAMGAGTKLGPYEILAPLGAGGMGEVYRARDPRIGRDVAIKVLPTAFALDADRLRRFEQETRAVGSLNHPNVLVIYDVGTQDQTPYLVAELLEGTTLREKLGAALPPRKAIEYALQIARGLAAAHDKGVLHRDLKPENIFITEDGHVKILDFGLAKLIRPETTAKSSAPTTPFETEPGAVMGTAGYMSPEQVRGESVDQRSDLFALGAILYEMLSGKRAFTGSTAVETLNAILKEEPPELVSQNGNISPAFERVVFHCLEKTPSQRFQSARDLAFAIEALSATSGASSRHAGGIQKTFWLRGNLPWVITVLACLAAVGLGFVALGARTKPETPIIRTSILPPHEGAFELLVWGMPLSPDGKYLAFGAFDPSGKGHLWIRSLDSMQARILADLEGGNSHSFWSPDGKSIGFFSNGKIYRVNVSGGASVPICDAADFRGGTWNRDGIIVFAPNAVGSPLYQVSAEGGTPAQLTQLAAGEQSHRFPHFLPDGRHFLYVTTPQRNVYAGSLDSKERVLLLQNASYTQYAQPGYLVFVKDGNLIAQPFDADRLKLTGAAVSITRDHVTAFSVAAVAAFSVSQTGILAYQKLSQSSFRLLWFDRSGKQTGIAGEDDFYSYPQISPDGKRVAVSISQPDREESDLWVIDLARNQKTRLTFHPANYWQPVWSPDGSQIAYGSDWNGGVKIYKINANGSGSEQLLLQSELPVYAESWSRDGKFLSYQTQAPDTQSDIWILPLTGNHKSIPFSQTSFFESGSRFSPDGRLLAYGSNESGRPQIYVRPVSEGGEKFQVSASVGFNMHWREDGKEIFYYDSGSASLMAVDVSSLNPFNAGTPKTLFKFPPGTEDQDISPDGQRILLQVASKQVRLEPITVVQNWTAALQK